MQPQDQSSGSNCHNGRPDAGHIDAVSIRDRPATCREAFYWLAIPFTFALGMAAGNLVAEHFKLGYLATRILFGTFIASITLGYVALNLDEIWACWIAYRFTRPLGASFGNLRSQPADYGGLGLGTIVTSALFLAATNGTVVCVSKTSVRQMAPSHAQRSFRRPSEP